MDRNFAEILLVEDSPGDIELTLEAFTDKVHNRVHVVEDGEDALDFLHKRGKFKDAPTPHLVLLDLNLPRKNGYEVLTEIKAHKHLQGIPVIILTSSATDRDVEASNGLNANAYVVKPMELKDFFSAIRTIEQFWRQVVKLPEHTE